MINKKIHRGLLASRQGFTLVETLMAILVLSVAIAGPLTIAQKGLQAALIAKDQISAFYLAQDAVEFIRFARDTNCLQAGGTSGCPAGTPTYATAPSWLNNTSNLTPCISNNGTAACTIDATNFSIASCGASTCPTPINYDSTNNWFTYSSGSASIFTRTINITSPVGANSNEAAIVVKVSWSDPLPHTITVNENILNWQ